MSHEIPRVVSIKQSIARLQPESLEHAETCVVHCVIHESAGLVILAQVPPFLQGLFLHSFGVWQELPMYLGKQAQLGTVWFSIQVPLFWQEVNVHGAMVVDGTVVGLLVDVEVVVVALVVVVDAELLVVRVVAVLVCAVVMIVEVVVVVAVGEGSGVPPVVDRNGVVNVTKGVLETVGDGVVVAEIDEDELRTVGAGVVVDGGSPAIGY